MKNWQRTIIHNLASLKISLFCAINVLYISSIISNIQSFSLYSTNLLMQINLFTETLLVHYKKLFHYYYHICILPIKGIKHSLLCCHSFIHSFRLDQNSERKGYWGRGPKSGLSSHSARLCSCMIKLAQIMKESPLTFSCHPNNGSFLLLITTLLYSNSLY